MGNFVSTSENQKLGPYRLHERLNSGGMAEIWHATDGDGTPYAIKRMHDHLRGGFLARKRFFDGCKILKEVHEHENIIGYVEHGKLEGVPFLLMEYVEANNLKQLYSASDDSLADYVSEILIDVAEALEHVHDCGYMHLDFKPDNILITRNVHVKLVDFDLARPIPKKPKKIWKNPGTPLYMAPEQLKREGIDNRADIFAFGVTMYELLTFKRPFPGERSADVLNCQLNRSKNFRNPRDINSGIPVAVEKVILQCIENDPDKRYPNMSVLVTQLKSALYV
ncbi:MAG: serine/threonine protein kinase [Candidatus Binatia bacterium]|jgi:serine/threonine protein kinase